MYQPSQLQAFLQGLGISAQKHLSQNFLIDGNIVRKIVQSASVTPDDLVLEIGPGPGALTQALLEAGAWVLAVEKDRTLAGALPKLPGSERLEVFCEDILEFNIEQALTQRLKPGTKAKLIANLPYHLTTPILARLVPLYPLISTLTVMVQKEVAIRMVAPAGGRDYSSLTVFLNFYADVALAFHVSRNCFFPKPKVDSSIVRLTLHPPLAVSDTEAFFIMTRTAFGHRRKMLRSSLSDLYPAQAVTEALQQLGLNPEARPEQLTVDNLRQLFEIMNNP